MDPALGMNDVGNAIPCPSYREAEFLGFFDNGIHLLLIRGHEFDIISTGKPEMPVTMLIGDIADVPNEVDTDQTGRSHPDGEHLIPRFRNMPQYSRLHSFVIFPVSIIFFDDFRKHLLEIRRTDISL
jgi:hypothetical protein